MVDEHIAKAALHLEGKGGSMEETNEQRNKYELLGAAMSNLKLQAEK